MTDCLESGILLLSGAFFGDTKCLPLSGLFNLSCHEDKANPKLRLFASLAFGELVILFPS